MHSDSYEKNYEKFLESKPYEEAEGDFFDWMRAAYEAGWRAAGGESPAQRAPLPFKRP